MKKFLLLLLMLFSVTLLFSQSSVTYIKVKLDTLVFRKGLDTVYHIEVRGDTLYYNNIKKFIGGGTPVPDTTGLPCDGLTIYSYAGALWMKMPVTDTVTGSPTFGDTVGCVWVDVSAVRWKVMGNNLYTDSAHVAIGKVPNTENELIMLDIEGKDKKYGIRLNLTGDGIGVESNVTGDGGDFAFYGLTTGNNSTAVRGVAIGDNVYGIRGSVQGTGYGGYFDNKCRIDSLFIPLMYFGTSSMRTVVWDTTTGMYFTMPYGASSMTYPSAGVPYSTGTAWGTSLDSSDIAKRGKWNTFSRMNTFTDTVLFKNLIEGVTASSVLVPCNDTIKKITAITPYTFLGKAEGYLGFYTATEMGVAGADTSLLVHKYLTPTATNKDTIPYIHNGVWYKGSAPTGGGKTDSTWSSITLGRNTLASGQLNFIASDNDQSNIAVNTSDKMLFSNAVGGYTFDNIVNVNGGIISNLYDKLEFINTSVVVNNICGSPSLSTVGTANLRYDLGFGDGTLYLTNEHTLTYDCWNSYIRSLPILIGSNIASTNIDAGIDERFYGTNICVNDSSKRIDINSDTLRFIRKPLIKAGTADSGFVANRIGGKYILSYQKLGGGTGDTASWTVNSATKQTSKTDTTVQGLSIHNSILFDSSATAPPHNNYQFFADTTNHTIGMQIGNDVTIQLGQEEVRYVFNNTGTTIPNRKAVYTNGVYTAGGNDVATIALAKADTSTTAFVLGLTTQDIPDKSYGYVTIRGHINGVNTDKSWWTEGDVLYLSDSTAGELINTYPDNPTSLKVRVGRLITKNATTGRINVRVNQAYRIEDLANTNISSPLDDDALIYTSGRWVNKPISTVSAGQGVEFYPNARVITASGTQATFAIETMFKTPLDSTEKVDAISVTAATSPVISGAYLYNTAFDRTSIDAGAWEFDFYASVSSTGAGRVSSILKNLYRVRPNSSTVTTTGTGTSRNCKASAGVPFATDSITASATRTACSFVQTPKGLYQITARNNDTSVTILVPSTYTNETDVVMSTWKLMFGNSTGTITALTTNYSLYSTNSVRPAYTFDTKDKLGKIIFGISNNTTTVNYVYQGTERYSHINTPLAVLHNNLAGLEGLAPYKHLSDAQVTLVNNAEQTTNKSTATSTSGTKYPSWAGAKAYVDSVKTTVSGSTNAWTDMTGTYASANSFTFTGTASDIMKYQRCLFACLSKTDTVTVNTVSNYIKYSRATGTGIGKVLQVGDAVKFVTNVPTASPVITTDRYYYVAVKAGNSAQDSVQISETPSNLTAIDFTATGTNVDMCVLKIGYVDSLTISGTTVTAIIQGDTILRTAPTPDNSFRIARVKHLYDYVRFITVPGEILGDASNSVGMFYLYIPFASYLMPCDFSVGTAAVGAGASCVFNIYENTVAKYTTGIDLTTTTNSNANNPSQKFLRKGNSVSMRITASAGATNKASNAQARIYYVPISDFTKP